MPTDLGPTQLVAAGGIASAMLTRSGSVRNATDIVPVGLVGAQPIEVIGTMPVVFSLGNFVLGTGGRFTELGMPAFGLIADLELDDQGTARLTVRCLQTNNDVVGFQPRPCDQRQSQMVLPALYPGLTMAGRVGVLDCTACFAPEVAR